MSDFSKPKKPIGLSEKEIYFDHVSTTYVLPEVAKVISEALTENWGNPSNMYAFGEKTHDLINDARFRIARAIGARPEEIFFTSGASEGNAWIAKQGSKMLISPYEHHNLMNNPNCTVVDLDYIKMALSKIDANDIDSEILHTAYKSFIWSHMYVNNETGEIFPIKEYVKIAHRLGMKFHSDMTQALGNIDIDVKDLKVDYATFTGHKVHAPKGVGFVYINSDTVDYVEPLLYGGKQEGGVRAGTENIPYILGLALAVETAVKQIPQKQMDCRYLKHLMENQLRAEELDFIINTPASEEKSVTNILNVAFRNISSENLMMDLSEQGIYCGTGSGCDSGNGDPSYVLQELKVPPEYIHGPIRFSFDSTNTCEEVCAVAHAIGELIREYKRFYESED